MKRNLLLLILLLGTFSIQAQIEGERYFDEIFDGVQVEQDIEYGWNLTVLTIPSLGVPLNRSLNMDVYHPMGDTQTERPVVIVAHTGSFLPPLDPSGNSVNGAASGVKTDSAMVEICTRLAKRGFVAIAYEYRQGWNPLAPTQSDRTNQLINAAYRGVQDTHTLLRYLKKTVAEENNPYGIDATKVAMMGQGTGGYLGYAMATLDKIEETQIEKFTIIDDEGNLGYYVNESVNGDIYGLGYPNEGDATPLMNVNHTGYEGDLDFVFCYGGALASTDWIDENSVPTAAMQTPNDPNAPFYEDILIVPVTGEGVVVVEGCGAAIPVFNSSGTNDILNTRQYNDPYSVRAQAASNATPGLENQGHAFPLYLSNQESAPWEWWSPEFWSTIESGVENPAAPGTFLSIHETQSFQAPDASPERGRTYIDTIINFFAPRAIVALGLPQADLLWATGVEEVTALDVTISPNPVESYLKIEAQDQLETVQIFDLSGRLVVSLNDMNDNSIRIERENMATGMYLVKVTAGEKSFEQKVLFR